MARTAYLASLVRSKPIASYTGEAQKDTGRGLTRSISLFHLMMIGVGSTIGTGIFVALTTAVPEAGPAVTLSFVIAGVAAALTALCYAELASVVPAAGSSYSYAYATLGEMPAFLIGACLVLEYGVAASAVAVGWGQYLNELFLMTTGWHIPDALAQPPGAGGIVNFPAVILVGLCLVLLLKGTSESAKTNSILVMGKLVVLALFVGIALMHADPANLHPFAPKGMAGIGAAASSIFFSYVGIDTIATAGEEVENPHRTLPLAIIGALLIVTVTYMLVAISAVGAQPWTKFAGQEAGLAVILHNVTGAQWPAIVLSAGAVASIMSVTLMCIFGQTRILYAMSKDGLLPAVFHKVDARRHVPRENSWIVSIFVALLAALVPLDALVNATSMGTLVAFCAVSAGVIILRRARPDLARGYRVPLYPVLPIASVGICLFLISQLPRDTFEIFGVWLAASAVIYLIYSNRSSALARSDDAG